MKRYLKKLRPLICIALFVGVIWIVFHVTAKYPILGEPVTYPVNQIDGFELTMTEGSWTPFRGHTFRYQITIQSEEVYQLVTAKGKSCRLLDRLVDGQWYRMERPEAIPEVIEWSAQVGNALGFESSFTQKTDYYGTRLEPGTYRLVLELTADDGSSHYLAEEFHVKNSIGIR